MKRRNERLSQEILVLESHFFFSVVSLWLLMGKAMTTMLYAVMGSSFFTCLTSPNAY